MPEPLATETVVMLAPENACAPPATESPSSRRPSFAEAVKWAGKGTYALADQALFSGANFLITVLLARSLQPAEYGAYSLAFAVFMLFATVHAALLIPVIDVGATIRRDGDRLELITGHTARILPDGACLECEGLTTPALRDKERNGRDVPYWEGDDAPGAPQVMSVNGMLASLAVTEVLRLIAGLTEDRQTRHWRYEPLEGDVYLREPISRGCAVCDISGRGDE